MLHRFKGLLVVVLLLVLSACTTQPNQAGKSSPYAANLNVPTLYLRGVFNWWGTVEAHKFKPFSGATTKWYADVQLEADGQAYDFKVADAVWSDDQNCGGYNTQLVIELNDAQPLHCSASAKTIQFTPTDHGVYRFLITQESDSRYTIRVEQRSA